jgi:transketolase
MINNGLKLADNLLSKEVKQEPIREGFGKGLMVAAERNPGVVALCADLTSSTKMGEFAKTYPERFIEVGIAEQNLVTVASGLALTGKVPFVSSYAAFSPGRNWEQIRTTVSLNETNVKIAGSHAGLMTGPDGATHQMLEDIALMRVLPNMTVVVPCDSIEAEKATIAIAGHKGGAYIRLARDKSAVVTTPKTPFDINKAQVFREGKDVTIIACGIMVYQALVAAEALSKKGIEAEVINCAVIKPLDTVSILASIRKTGRVVTVEEAQIAGGMGSAIAELAADQHPVPVKRMGMRDHFGESGTPDELLEQFGLTSTHIVKEVEKLIQ